MKKNIEVFNNPWKVNIVVDNDFQPLNKTSSLLNFGVIQYESPSGKEDVYWDNISNFISFNKKLKKECKKELKEKGLYKKGIFKLLKEILRDLIERGYLKEI